MFPDVSHADLAKAVFADSTLKSRLEKTIEKGLNRRQANRSAAELIDSQYPQASIVNSALVYRRSLPLKTVFAEFEQLKRGEANKYTGATGWIHNNFIGCLLSIYDAYAKTCPVYAGYDTFTLLAHGNLRHFIELCHKSLQEEMISGPNFVVAPSAQATAAKQASTAFLGEVRRSGRLGNRLHAFVLQLGSLFALAHRRASQSEPEQSHFAITNATSIMSEADIEFLAEAIKWSVLFEEPETKQKNPGAPENFEYVLNPIYAPYFNISFRKRRKLEIKLEEFRTLAHGSYSDARALLRRYTQKWAIDVSEANPSLFSHLNDGEN